MYYIKLLWYYMRYIRFIDYLAIEFGDGYSTSPRELVMRLKADRNGDNHV